jgi:hypothetical protein
MATQLSAIADGRPLVIPTSVKPWTRQRINLDGRTFTIELMWNMTEERWHLSIYDAEEEPIVLGVCVVANWPLLRYSQFDPRMPPGEMLAQDLTGDGSPPGVDDFGLGKRVELTYYAQNL